MSQNMKSAKSFRGEAELSRLKVTQTDYNLKKGKPTSRRKIKILSPANPPKSVTRAAIRKAVIEVIAERLSNAPRI